MQDKYMFDQDSVILDLEPDAAVLLGKAVEAGIVALAIHLSLEEGEFLKGLAMLLADTAGGRPRRFILRAAPDTRRNTASRIDR
jgi:hypothetical protein